MRFVYRTWNPHATDKRHPHLTPTERKIRVSFGICTIVYICSWTLSVPVWFCVLFVRQALSGGGIDRLLTIGYHCNVGTYAHANRIKFYYVWFFGITIGAASELSVIFAYSFQLKKQRRNAKNGLYFENISVYDFQRHFTIRFSFKHSRTALQFYINQIACTSKSALKYRTFPTHTFRNNAKVGGFSVEKLRR